MSDINKYRTTRKFWGQRKTFCLNFTLTLSTDPLIPRNWNYSTTNHPPLIARSHCTKTAGPIPNRIRIHPKRERQSRPLGIGNMRRSGWSPSQRLSEAWPLMAVGGCETPRRGWRHNQYGGARGMLLYTDLAGSWTPWRRLPANCSYRASCRRGSALS